jgi:hypothetical protein
MRISAALGSVALYFRGCGQLKTGSRTVGGRATPATRRARLAAGREVERTRNALRHLAKSPHSHYRVFPALQPKKVREQRYYQGSKSPFNCSIGTRFHRAWQCCTQSSTHTDRTSPPGSLSRRNSTQRSKAFCRRTPFEHFYHAEQADMLCNINLALVPTA